MGTNWGSGGAKLFYGKQRAERKASIMRSNGWPFADAIPHPIPGLWYIFAEWTPDGQAVLCNNGQVGCF